MTEKKGLDSECMDFYYSLLDEVMKNQHDSEAIFDRLYTSEEYENDFVYRVVVDTVKIADLYMKSKPQEIIPIATILIEKATMLELWQLVSINHNLLGTAYQMLDILERAIECYKSCIQNEKEHGFIRVSSLAYNNIGLMYLNLKSYKKASKYLEKAIEVENLEKSESKSHKIKMVSFRCHFAVVLCHMGSLSEAKEILDEVMEMDPDTMNPEAKYFYHMAQLHYSFNIGDYEEAKKNLEYSKKTIGSQRKIWMKSIISEYLTLCDKMKLNYHFYLDALRDAEKLQDEEEGLIDVSVYESLRKYYRQIDDVKKHGSVTSKYIKALEKNEEYVRNKQLESLELVENLIEEKMYVSKIKSINNELKLVAEEALRNKKSLQEANNRLNFINEIGKKMTSSLELSKVIEMIYANLYSNLPINSFVIMLAEPDKNRLRSLAHYDNQILQPEFTISLDNPNSIFVECYKTEQSIVSKDVYEDERFKEHKPIYIGVMDIKSVIYVPLKVENTLVGVCSVQSKEADIYTDKHLEFLEMFTPYLSIAVNNAVYSLTLERAIHSYQKAQEELQKANSKLEHLSSLDGLTKISNRRDFEKRILKIISLAIKEKTTVSIIMIDIDNFKIYNDTYGHLEGDEALKKVAKVLSAYLETEGGISARFGGEEFIGAVKGFSVEKVKEVGNTICKKVYDLNIENKKTMEGRLTVSVGIAFARVKDNNDRSLLMKLADDSLYEAKKTGKNKAIVAEVEPF